MKKVYAWPKSLKRGVPFHYCPGCGHSIIHKLIAQVIDEMGIREKVICVPPAGCAVLAYNYLDIDMVEAPHGRAAAVATGIKRVLPQNLVFSYQGDGDLAAIGTAETIHAANRSENISIFFINNAVYGMTGGQMAPTTLLGQKTSTSPGGREAKRDGYPIDMCKLLATLKGAVYLERTAVNSPANILKTKKAIIRSFQIQRDDQGFSLIDILSPCPTNWRMNSVESCRWIDEVMIKVYPLGVIKDETK
jgi:2-oxoglutarate ferredoxin oxidoreductase subunit beta